MRTKEEKRAYRNALYQQRKLAGVCIECAAPLQDDDGLRCVDCTDRAAAARKRYRESAAGRAKERAANKRAFDRRRSMGLCGHCEAPAVPGRASCAGHLAYHRRKSLEWISAKRAGILPLRPKSTAQPLATEQPYRPIDELESKPRVRIVRAFAYLDWTSFEELRTILNIPTWDENDSAEYDAYSQMVSRLTKLGILERRVVRSKALRNHAPPEYRLTDAGREELQRYRAGILTRITRKAA